MPQNTFFLSSGHLNEYGISLTVDALRLDRMVSLPKMVSNHVELCDDCKQQIMQIVDQMKEQPVNTAEPHPYFDAVQTRPVRWYRAAAILMLFLAGGTILYLSQNHRVEKNPGYSQREPTADSTSSSNVSPKENQQQLYTDNFIPSPNLDNVITSQFRSSSVEVLSPDIGEFVHPPITFRWKNIGRPVKLKILTNTEITLMTSMVNTNIFSTKKKFEPGLYYWKLEENDELLFMGKFFIR